MGCGMGGFGAACAVSRHGAKTLLIERFTQRGEIGSIAGVGSFNGYEHKISLVTIDRPEKEYIGFI